MQMNSKILSQIKNKLKIHLKNKDILDIIVFGSAIKGKAIPKDIDIAIISDKDIKLNIHNFHISLLKPKDFLKPLSLIHTLFREGYSLKNEKFLSEIHKFSNKVLFIYKLTALKPSIKVKIVNILKGKNKNKGMVEENKGKWLANQVFISPMEKDHIFEKFFIYHKISFNKYYILIH